MAATQTWMLQTDDRRTGSNGLGQSSGQARAFERLRNWLFLTLLRAERSWKCVCAGGALLPSIAPPSNWQKPRDLFPEEAEDSGSPDALLEKYYSSI